MATEKNQKIIIDIVDISAEGTGVGRHEGMAIFVSGAAIGDKVEVLIIKAKKNYAIGKIERIIKPSKDRIENDCPAFPSCGGCAFRHISYDAEKKHKESRVSEAFRRIGHLDVELNPIITGSQYAYRNKAQYPVRMQNGRLAIGFFAARSHRVINCLDCKLQPTEFSGILKTIRKWLLSHPVTIYNEETKKGIVRHIYLRKAFTTGEIMVCMVINNPSLPSSKSLVDALIAENENIKTVVLNINTEDTNVILGDICKNIYGDGYITDILCGKKIILSPLSFYQVNHEAAEKLYAKAGEYAALTGNEIVLDLYCGTGTIGLSLAEKCKRLMGVEIIPEAVKDARKNAELNNITNADFVCADAALITQKLIDEGIKPDVIIVDPPRKGLDAEVIDSIVTLAPKRLVYVSCDPATLARDLKILTDKGYEIKDSTPIDMFPRTVHVETVVLMSRVKE
ncbi:MAG TPA: 23S rRNA (uracil(1939)-C(5))-methyltransferase RlmD [Clostridiales bacterium]|nr:23S rRNA (uracil(1939)-C(5))-methyltransferase RlmD [Clostridiales bacterium]